MVALSDLLRSGVALAREELLRANTFQRVARQTGMFDQVSFRGVRALIKARGKSNPSVVLRYHAANQPHRTALIYRQRAYSFFELDQRVDEFARALRAIGIRSGDSVVLMMKNVPEFIMLQQAIGRLGGAAVTISWRSTLSELRYLVDNSGARCIFFDASVANVVAELMPQAKAQLADRAYATAGEASGFKSLADLIAQGAGVDPDQAIDDLAEEAAVVIYTSGTTGKPKGAVRKFSRDAMVQVLSFMGETPMRVGQTHLAVCPLYHSTAFGLVALSYVLGSTVVLLDQFEPQQFLDALEQYNVDHTAVVPTMLHRTLGLGADAIRSRDTSNLKAIFTGGAPLSATLATDIMAAYGDKLYNFYGATETGLVTLATPADLREAPGTIGRCIGGNDIRLIADDGTLAAPGEVAELFVRSGNLVDGYHGNLDATQASMKEGYFSVGDLARCDARGHFFLEGRKRDMIISGGVNVYPREVESALAAHPAVGEAAVIGVADDEWGERVRAFVALRPGASCDEADLLAFCREQLAGPKRPREIIIMDQLPRNPTGKVLKRQLRELSVPR